MRQAFIVWIVTICVFVLMLLIFVPKNWPGISVFILIFDVSIGILAFLVLMVNWITSGLSKHHKIRKIIYAFKTPALVVTLLFLSLFSGGLIVNKGDFAETFRDTSEIISSLAKANRPTPVPVPTLIPFPTSEPLEPTEAPYVNPDPTVNCNVNSECGGGTRRLTKSQCNNSICCGFTDTYWVFYTDKDQCDIDQEKYNSNRSNSFQNNNTYQTTYQAPYIPPVYIPPQYNSYVPYNPYLNSPKLDSLNVDITIPPPASIPNAPTPPGLCARVGNTVVCN